MSRVPALERGANGLIQTFLIIFTMVGIVTRGVIAADVKYCATFNTGTDFNQGQRVQ